MATQKIEQILVKDSNGTLLNLAPKPQVIVKQDIEYSAFPTTGDKTQLYVDKNTKKIYIWVD